MTKTLTVLSLALATSAFGGVSIELSSRMTKVLDSGVCKTGNPISSMRAEIAGLRKGAKAEKEFDAALKNWAELEKKSGKPSSDLNWVRVLNPWILGEDFPSRPAFEGCAGELRTIMDVGVTADGVKEWTECLDLIYPGDLPAEFERLQKCLESRQNAGSSTK